MGFLVPESFISPFSERPASEDDCCLMLATIFFASLSSPLNQFRVSASPFQARIGGNTVGRLRNSDSEVWTMCPQRWPIAWILREQIEEASLEMKSTYFVAPQPPHRHLPTSSKRFTPGGAWPFTSLQLLQIKAKRALGKVSSSPSSTSMIRSYHRDPSLA